jgi:hypothetical protein
LQCTLAWHAGNLKIPNSLMLNLDPMTHVGNIVNLSSCLWTVLLWACFCFVRCYYS